MTTHVIKFLIPEIVQELLALRREKTITPNDFVVGVALSSFMRRDDLTAYPSNTTLSKMTGIDISDIGRSIKNLVEKKFITTTRGNDNKTYYTSCLGELSGGEFPHPTEGTNEYIVDDFIDDEEQYEVNNNNINKENNNNKYYGSLSMEEGKNVGNNPSKNRSSREPVFVEIHLKISSPSATGFITEISDEKSL